LFLFKNKLIVALFMDDVIVKIKEQRINCSCILTQTSTSFARSGLLNCVLVFNRRKKSRIQYTTATTPAL
jgi:hypothetical protein